MENKNKKLQPCLIIAIANTTKEEKLYSTFVISNGKVEALTPRHKKSTQGYTTDNTAKLRQITDFRTTWLRNGPLKHKEALK